MFSLTASVAVAAVSAPLWLSWPSAPSSDDFGETWYDGRAEVNGYRWHGERYGERRSGEAVAIFVTEPFDSVRHVKADRPGAAEGPVVTALKLNLVRDFQTGLYDYNTMTSVFVRADDFAPMKTTFSSAEWCGHVYEEIDFRGDETRIAVRSYFQGESTDDVLPAPEGGLLEEQLFVWLRGLRGAPLDPGESRRVPFLASPFERRLRHREAEWGTARITRGESTSTVDVPAGSFEATTYRVVAPDGRTGAFHLEQAAPRRLLAWTWTRDGAVTDAGELTGTERLRYWELNAEGDEGRRADLGLD